MTPLGGYLSIGAVAAVTTAVLTPVVRWAAERSGVVTQPDERRVHTKPTASVGGVAMLGGLLAAIGLATLIRPGGIGAVASNNFELLGVVISAVIITSVGLLDDVMKSNPKRPRVEGISPPAKMTGMVLAGAVLALTGATMWHFRLPFLRVLVLPADVRPLVTVLWLVVMANAVNFIDGLDGLAAGIVAIASGAFFIYAYRLEDAQLLFGQSVGPLVAIVACGVCLGFLPYNVHPARIFMGDSGALLLGQLMAVSTAVVGGRADPSVVAGTSAASGQTWFFFAPLFIPLAVLGVPLLDLFFAVLRRAARRTRPSVADKDHLHHRLLRLGHGHRRSVLILWLWTAILSGFVLYPAFSGRGNGLVPFGVAALALLLFTILHPAVKRPLDETT